MLELVALQNLYNVYIIILHRPLSSTLLSDNWFPPDFD